MNLVMIKALDPILVWLGSRALGFLIILLFYTLVKAWLLTYLGIESILYIPDAFIVAIIAVVAFLLLSTRDLQPLALPPLRFWQTAGWIALSCLSFMLFLSTRADINRILSMGIAIDPGNRSFVYWDAGRWLGWTPLGEYFLGYRDPPLGDGQLTSLRKQIYLAHLPTGPAKVKWWGSSEYSGRPAFDDNARAILSVNGNRVDVTEQFAKAFCANVYKCTPKLLDQPIEASWLKQGVNTLSFEMLGGGRQIVRVFSIANYSQATSKATTLAFSYVIQGRELLWSVEEPTSWGWQSFYRSGLIFLAVAILTAFIGCFGPWLVREYSLQLLGSLTIAVIAFNLIVSLLTGYTAPKIGMFSYLTSQITVWLMRFGFSDAYLATSPDPAVPVLSAGGFTIGLGVLCSGVEGMTLFGLLYSLRIIIGWQTISKLRFVLLLGMGIIGAFVLNSLRICILMLIGIYISPELALGFAHQNLGWVLFIVYFILFDLATSRYLNVEETSTIASTMGHG